MRKDYHMHPTIIQTPERIEDYINTAISNNIDEICITDHMPLIGNDAKDRIPAGHVKQYCEKAHEIAEKYKNVISIKTGIEIDYHPLITDEIEAVLKDGDFDFVLGSSHLHAISQLDIFNKVSSKEDYAASMLENTISAAKSGYFSAIAHIDMYKWIFFNPKRFPLEGKDFCENEHLELIDKTLDAIKKSDIFLEINTHFAANTNNTNNIYPSETIMKMAIDKNLKFSYGSDSHKADHVGVFLDFLHESPIYSKAIQKWENA